MNFEPIIDAALKAEGGYTNDPADSGGETNFGITAAVARAAGYVGEMKDMPVSFARDVYFGRYISKPGFDKVAMVHERIAAELIDTGINMGPAVAATFLQRWLNAFNDGGTRYQDVFVDGRLGQVTVAALASYLQQRGEQGARVLIRALNCSQGARYLEIAEGAPKNERFMYGWIVNRVLEE